MEERKYTFYDRYQKVKYANITAEELEVLNIFYNKEHYMFDQQHQRNNTVLFCGLESENGCATDLSQIVDVTLHRILQLRSSLKNSSAI